PERYLRFVRWSADHRAAICEGPAGHSGPGVLLFGHTFRASRRKTPALAVGFRKAAPRPDPSGHAATLAGAAWPGDTAHPTLGAARACSARHALVWAELLPAERRSYTGSRGARGCRLQTNPCRSGRTVHKRTRWAAVWPGLSIQRHRTLYGFGSAREMRRPSLRTISAQASVEAPTLGLI